MTEKWKRDTGILFGLVFVILGIWSDPRFLYISIAFLVAVLFVPALLTPVAYLWLKLAEILGFVVNKIFFALVFFLVVTPVGVIRRLITRVTPYQEFGSGLDSAFVERNHVWDKEDISTPY